MHSGTAVLAVEARDNLRVCACKQVTQEMMEAMTVVELLNRSVDMMAEAVSRGATPADLQVSARSLV